MYKFIKGKECDFVKNILRNFELVGIFDAYPHFFEFFIELVYSFL